MKEKTRRYLSVFLTLLLFIAVLPMGVTAESHEDDSLPQTDPIVSETKASDESANGEKDGTAQSAPHVPSTKEEDSDNVPRDSSQDNTESDSNIKDETPPADDGKEPIETSPDSEQKANNNEEIADENVTDSEQTLVGEDGQSEEESRENEDTGATPNENNEDPEIVEDEFGDENEYNEDLEPGVENELGEEPDQPEILNPTIRLKASFDGEKLKKGMPVTIKAAIDGIPEGTRYNVQWRNNLSGEFRDVPGETDKSVTFVADERNVNCSWQLVLKVTVPENDA